MTPDPDDKAPLPQWLWAFGAAVAVACALAATALWMSHNEVKRLRTRVAALERESKECVAGKDGAESRLRDAEGGRTQAEARSKELASEHDMLRAERDALQRAAPVQVTEALEVELERWSKVKWHISVRNISSVERKIWADFYCFKVDDLQVPSMRAGGVWTLAPRAPPAPRALRGEFDWPSECVRKIYALIVYAGEGNEATPIAAKIF